MYITQTFFFNIFYEVSDDSQLSTTKIQRENFKSIRSFKSSKSEMLLTSDILLLIECFCTIFNFKD